MNPKGVLFYWASEGKNRLKKITLTLTASDDDLVLAEGLSGLRRRRREAREQGAPLSYADLSALLLSSLATLKRDIVELRKQGIEVPLRKKRNGFLGGALLALLAFILLSLYPIGARAENRPYYFPCKAEREYTLILPYSGIIPNGVLPPPYEDFISARTVYASGKDYSYLGGGESVILRDRKVYITGIEQAFYAAELKMRHGEGDPFMGRKKDFASGHLRGELSSIRLPKLQLRVLGSAGFDEWGYPLSGGLALQTLGFKKLSLGAQYTAATGIPKKSESVSWVDRNLGLTAAYKITPGLEVRSLYNYYLREWEGGGDFTKKTYEGAVLFRPVPSTHTEFRAMLEEYPYGDMVRLKGAFTKQIIPGAGLALDSMRLHYNWNDYTEEQLGVNLSRDSKDKKTRIGLDWRLKLSESPYIDNQEQRMIGTVTRKF
jgi:hypothetical protein